MQGLECSIFLPDSPSWRIMEVWMNDENFDCCASSVRSPDGKIGMATGCGCWGQTRDWSHESLWVRVGCPSPRKHWVHLWFQINAWHRWPSVWPEFPAYLESVISIVVMLHCIECAICQVWVSVLCNQSGAAESITLGMWNWELRLKAQTFVTGTIQCMCCRFADPLCSPVSYVVMY